MGRVAANAEITDAETIVMQLVGQTRGTVYALKRPADQGETCEDTKRRRSSMAYSDYRVLVAVGEQAQLCSIAGICVCACAGGQGRSDAALCDTGRRTP